MPVPPAPRPCPCCCSPRSWRPDPAAFPEECRHRPPLRSAGTADTGPPQGRCEGNGGDGPAWGDATTWNLKAWWILTRQTTCTWQTLNKVKMNQERESPEVGK